MDTLNKRVNGRCPGLFHSVRSRKNGCARGWPLATLVVLLAFGIVAVERKQQHNKGRENRNQHAERSAGLHANSEEQPFRAYPVAGRPETLSPKVIAEAHRRLPMSFEANQGQAANDVLFISRGSGYSLLLTQDGM